MITFFDQNGHYDLDKWLPQLNSIATADEPFILICRTGNRTGVISGFLDNKMNYSKVYNVTDGITKWIDQGNQTVKP
jgi:rhodanese-related sulfurtransferase